MPIRRLSWPGVLVVAGSTILSWFNASPIVSPAKPAREVSEPDRPVHSQVPTAASVAAMQLHDWSPRLPAPGRPERDIFTFKRRRSAPAVVAPPPGGLLEAAPGQRPLALFKLIGFAEDAGPDGAIRTAIISGQGQLFLVKQDETVATIYRVGAMTADSVELIDSTGGPAVLLALK